VQSNKQRWFKPDVRSIDRSVFASWDRDKLLRVQDLVQRALELIEASRVPDVEAKVRAVLTDLDATLRESSGR
jgi:hypothetical protein